MPTKKQKERAQRRLKEEMPSILQHLRETEAATGAVPTLMDALINLASKEVDEVGVAALLFAPHTLFVMGFSTGLRLKDHDEAIATAYLKAIMEFAETTPDDYGRPDLVCEMLVAAKKALDLYAERRAAAAAAE